MSAAQVDRKKVVISKFPLRLMPSVRKIAETFSEREGVSLNQFINVAVCEKLAHMEHEEWVARRPKPPGASIARALKILDRPAAPAIEGDRLPKGYVSVRGAGSGERMRPQSKAGRPTRG